MAWSANGFGGPPLLIIRSFNRQKVLVALQKIQATIILCRTVMATRKVFFGLGVLLGILPISLHGLLRAISDGFRS